MLTLVLSQIFCYNYIMKIKLLLCCIITFIVIASIFLGCTSFEKSNVEPKHQDVIDFLLATKNTPSQNTIIETYPISNIYKLDNSSESVIVVSIDNSSTNYHYNYSKLTILKKGLTF